MGHSVGDGTRSSGSADVATTLVILVDVGADGTRPRGVLLVLQTVQFLAEVLLILDFWQTRFDLIDNSTEVLLHRVLEGDHILFIFNESLSNH